MASFTLCAVFVLLWFLSHVSAQAAQAPLQTVHVGRSGSSYEPPSLNARAGEVIQFVFEGRAHGIVQSGDGTPCVPLPGGFRSGVAGPGVGNQSSSAPPVWNLVITNTSAPIWFFCPVMTPVLHCQQGMVGVINPPNQTAITQYMSVARAFTGTVDSTLVSPTLSGIGASATATPAPIVTTSSSSSSTPTSTPPVVQVTPASMTSDNDDDSHTAAIVGGTIAGVVAIMATIIIVTLIIRKRTRRSNRDAMNVSTYYPGATESPPNTGMSERSGFSKYTIERRVGSPQARTGPGVITPFYSTPRENPNELPPSNISDYTRARTSPELEMRKQTSNNTLRPLRGVASDEGIQRMQHPYAAPHGRSNSGGDEDPINELAKEVAAVLLRDGGHETAVAGSSTSSGDRNKPSGPRTKSGPESSDPPPHYRSDLGHIA